MAPGSGDRPTACGASWALLTCTRLGPMGEEAECWVGSPFPAGQAKPADRLAYQRDVVEGRIRRDPGSVGVIWAEIPPLPHAGSGVYG